MTGREQEYGMLIGIPQRYVKHDEESITIPLLLLKEVVKEAETAFERKGVKIESVTIHKDGRFLFIGKKAEEK